MDTTERDPLWESRETETSTQYNTHIFTNEDYNVQNGLCFMMKVFSASANGLVQTLIGVNVGVTLWFAFKSTPISAFQLHVGLSVLGYQLLMAHGIFYLRSSNLLSFSLSHRRRFHWVLQLSGSILAIAGTAIMIKNKTDAGREHFNSVHGKLALAALVFTCLSLINGVLSLYVVELRHWIPAKVSKTSHIILGSAAFGTSSACLAYGFNKKSFVEWASQEFAYVMTTIVIVYTSLILFLPCYSVLKKLLRFIKIKIC